MRLKEQLIIHVGYPKTATTTLQDSLFDKHPRTLYLKKDWEKKWHDIIVAIFTQREIPFKNDIEKYRKEFIDIVNLASQNRKNIAPAPCVIFSDEGLVGQAGSLRYYPKHYRWAPDPVSIARKLKVLFDNDFTKKPKILITIREQTSFARSYYAQMYSNFNQLKSYRGFNNFIQNYFLNDKFDHFGSLYNYWEIVNLYSELFGRENVFVLPFEYIKYNDDRYKEIITDITGINKNEINDYLKKFGSQNKRKVGGNYYKVKQISFFDLLYPEGKTFPTHYPYLDNIFFKILRHIRNPFTKKIKLNLNLDLEKRLKEKYAKHNMQLDKEYDLDLKKYKYY